MSSKSKTVFRYGLVGFVLGAAIGFYTANCSDAGQQCQKLDVKKSAQIGLALFDFIRKASAL